MKNTIIASVEFDYKGETHRPSVRLDLDQLMETGNNPESLHQLIATNNNIDSYSYEYEVLLGEPILFKDAEGIATDFLIDNNFDFSAYENAWREYKLFDALSTQLKQELGIDNIDQHLELKQLILQAYQIGQQQA